MAPTQRAGASESLAIAVAMRIRPLNYEEVIAGATQTAHKVDENWMMINDPADDVDDVLRLNRSRGRQFVFDTVFDSTSSQEEVYDCTTRPLINEVIKGFNATVFAYGATGAGKTYTMLGTDEEPGVMALALRDLFVHIHPVEESNFLYSVSMSYSEIYNETIRDLLNPESGFLDLREDSNGNQLVAGITDVEIDSEDQVMNLLLLGNRHRTQEPTAANKTSSRSHAVLEVKVQRKNRVHGATDDTRSGKLVLVDLAGSERASVTHNKGQRLQEGKHINRSLLALANAINALASGEPNVHVKYRDSKLTRLLKDSLSGNCKTVMVAHISPASNQFEESRNTLIYAERTKSIKTKVQRNVVGISYRQQEYLSIISELQREVERLRYRLTESTAANNVSSNNSDNFNRLKDQLLKQFDKVVYARQSVAEAAGGLLDCRHALMLANFVVVEHEAKQLYDEDLDMSSIYLTETGDTIEPDDVRAARLRLNRLAVEQPRLERIKKDADNELQVALNRYKQLQHTIERAGVNADEVVLLVSCHESGIERMKLRLEQITWTSEKEVLLTRLQQHSRITESIIQRQRQIIDDHNLDTPVDLKVLYHMYEMNPIDSKILKKKKDFHVSLDNLDVMSVCSTDDPSLLPVLPERERSADKIFKKSPKASQVEHLPAVSVTYKRTNTDEAIPHSLGKSNLTTMNAGSLTSIHQSWSNPADAAPSTSKVVAPVASSLLLSPSNGSQAGGPHVPSALMPALTQLRKQRLTMINQEQPNQAFIKEKTFTKEEPAVQVPHRTEIPTGNGMARPNAKVVSSLRQPQQVSRFKKQQPPVSYEQVMFSLNEQQHRKNTRPNTPENQQRPKASRRAARKITSDTDTSTHYGTSHNNNNAPPARRLGYRAPAVNTYFNTTPFSIQGQRVGKRNGQK